MKRGQRITVFDHLRVIWPKTKTTSELRSELGIPVSSIRRILYANEALFSKVKLAGTVYWSVRNLENLWRSCDV